MPLSHASWSPADRLPVPADAAVAEDDDLALGWECAVPALQVEAWEPMQAIGGDPGSAGA